jgi:hypothetical protein
MNKFKIGDYIYFPSGGWYGKIINIDFDKKRYTIDWFLNFERKEKSDGKEYTYTFHYLEKIIEPVDPIKVTKLLKILYQV